MLSEKVKKYVAVIVVAGFLVGAGLGTWVLVARGQSPALPTTPEGAIIIPAEMIQQFEAATGEAVDKLQKDIKELQARQNRLQNFYVQLRMNTLAAAKIPANQYDQWQLDAEKKTLIKVDPKTQQPVGR